jgi:hypothetical protein
MRARLTAGRMFRPRLRDPHGADGLALRPYLRVQSPNHAWGDPPGYEVADMDACVANGILAECPRCSNTDWGTLDGFFHLSTGKVSKNAAAPSQFQLRWLPVTGAASVAWTWLRCLGSHSAGHGAAPRPGTGVRRTTRQDGAVSRLAPRAGARPACPERRRPAPHARGDVADEAHARRPRVWCVVGRSPLATVGLRIWSPQSPVGVVPSSPMQTARPTRGERGRAAPGQVRTAVGEPPDPRLHA